MTDPRREAQRIAEEFTDRVYEPSSGVDTSTGYATLKIDMTVMSEEERQLVYEAETLLSSAGVIFDTNSAGGFRNWELDWSLSGAVLDTREVNCSLPICDSAGKDIWVIYRLPSGRTCKYAYCSMSCRDRDIERVVIEMGWECLLRL